ncbi:hypothetical protein DPMN_058673 [Dreissena polymorpha]|uniref:Uncharacterized protein n=1 Tax=Dreissena polymorpha TaxID=45954 RepID=A0A9D4C2J0_DREPO|nr:hypothetical protein DPMN_058673 [Dreissena polymorpha]
MPPPTDGHVFSPIPTIFKLPNRENCHYMHIEKNAPPTGGHVFFHRSRPFSYSSETSIEPMKTAPPTGGHTIILTNFELGRDFIGAKLLTKFHEDGARNQMLTDVRTDIRRTKTGHKSSPEQSVFGRTDGLTDGQTDEKTDGHFRTDGRTDGRTD